MNRLLVRIACALLLSFSAACFSDPVPQGDTTTDGGGTGTASGGDGDGDGPSDCNVDGCPASQTCIADRCQDDGDADGTPDPIDCDPTDPEVSETAQRPCASDCAPGTERCTEGSWGACDAPTDCDCDPGDGMTVPAEEREVPCGNCGTLRQACSPDGIWSDVGTCEGQGTCSPGNVEMGEACGALCGVQERSCNDQCQWEPFACVGEGTCQPGNDEDETQPCGSCGEQETRTRTCTDGCEWSDWSEWSECVPAGMCTPDDVQMEEQACGNCGIQTRTRTCAADGCSWGNWTDWGDCTGQGPCAEGQVDEKAEPCGDCDGMQTSQRLCTSMCQWGGWFEVGGCVECQGSGQPNCNANKGVCECGSTTCGRDEMCCTRSSAVAGGNYCTTGNWCLSITGCSDNSACAPGYYCCGYTGEPLSGSCTAMGETCA